jgi:thioesterase domain-containing protein
LKFPKVLEKRVYFLGWSLGAILAIESAHILSEKLKIERMILLDPPAGTYFLKDEENNVRNNIFKEFIIDLMDGKVNNLSGNDHTIHSLVDVRATLQKQSEFYKDYPLVELEELFNVYSRHSNYLAKYTVDQFDFSYLKELLVFFADESFDVNKRNKFNDYFTELNKDNVAITILPCDHYSIIKQQIVFETMKNFLRII